MTLGVPPFPVRNWALGLDRKLSGVSKAGGGVGKETYPFFRAAVGNA